MFTPLTEGSRIRVNPTVPSATPADMLLMLRAMASKRLAFFTRPVLSLT